MNQKFEPSGTSPEATRDSILTAELAKLQSLRVRIKNENQRYMDRHPELRPLMDEFLAAIIRDKPSDLIKYGALFFNSLKNKGGLGMSPVAIAGPSGVGKTTLIKMLTDRYPRLFGSPVQHTTRAMRHGEEDGVEFYFVDRSQFEDSIARNEFVHFYNLHTNMYATSFKAVEKVRLSNKVCLMDLDTESIQRLKTSDLDCKLIFINAPDIETLKTRLAGRGTESADRIAARLVTAEADMEFGTREGNFDAVIMNEDMHTAFDEIVYTLQGWYPDMEVDFGPSGK